MRASVRRLPAVVAVSVPLALSAAAAAGAEPVATAVVVDAGDGTEHGDMSDAEMAGHGDATTSVEPAAPAEPEHVSTGDHDDVATTPTRPRVAVLTTFALVNAGVLITAAVLRRRERRSPRHRPRTPSSPAPAATPA